MPTRQEQGADSANADTGIRVKGNNKKTAASSTEKLLSVIRSSSRAGASETRPDGDQPDVALAEHEQPPVAEGGDQDHALPQTRGKRSLGSYLNTSIHVLPSTTATTVGIQLGAQALRMVKVTGSGTARKLKDAAIIPLRDGTRPGEAGSTGNLRRELRRFCGSAPCDIWILIPALGVEIFHIQVPKTSRDRLDDAIYWTVQKEKPFDAETQIFDYEILGEAEDAGGKLDVLCYVTPKARLDEAKSLLSGTGFRPTGVTVSPFSLQNVFRAGWAKAEEEDYACLHMGRRWSRIDIYHAGRLLLSRVIKAGTQTMVEALQDNYNEQIPEPHGPPNAPGQAEDLLTTPTGLALEQPELTFSSDLDESALHYPQSGADEGALHFSQTPGETTGQISGQQQTEAENAEPSPPAAQAAPRLMERQDAKQVFKHKMLRRGERPESPGAELDEREIFAFILPALERLARQIERTLDYATSSARVPRAERLYLTGEICANPLLVEYLESQIGLPNTPLDPLSPEARSVVPANLSTSLGRRLELTQAAGLALSSNDRTPNLLFTYKDRAKQRKTEVANKRVALAFLLIVALLAGAYIFQQGTVKALTTKHDGLAAQLKAFNPKPDEVLLAAMAGAGVARTKTIKTYAQRFESLAVMRELSTLTPGRIELNQAVFDLGPPTSKTPPKEDGKAAMATPGTQLRLFKLRGVVSGEAEAHDAVLSAYVANLQRSPLFGSVLVGETEPGVNVLGAPILTFSLDVALNQD